jgi:hypothetical protein
MIFLKQLSYRKLLQKIHRLTFEKCTREKRVKRVGKEGKRTQLTPLRIDYVGTG